MTLDPMSMSNAPPPPTPEATPAAAMKTLKKPHHPALKKPKVHLPKVHVAKPRVAKPRVAKPAAVPRARALPRAAALPTVPATPVAAGGLGSLLQKEAVRVGGSIVSRSVSSGIVQAEKEAFANRRAAQKAAAQQAAQAPAPASPPKPVPDAGSL